MLTVSYFVLVGLLKGDYTIFKVWDHFLYFCCNPTQCKVKWQICNREITKRTWNGKLSSISSLGKSVIFYLAHKLQQTNKSDLSRKAISPENTGHVPISPNNI